MPLAAAAKKAAAPSDRELVTAVEEILAGEDVQSFNIKDLMRRLSALRKSWQCSQLVASSGNAPSQLWRSYPGQVCSQRRSTWWTSRSRSLS